MRRIALLVVAAALVAIASGATGASRVTVSLVGGHPAPTAGRPWTAGLAVRPVSYAGAVRVSATGPGRLDVLASGGHGSYRARLVFPAAGRWTLTARAGTSTSRLGAVQVRKAVSAPLTFVWPTTLDVEPGGTLLLVENGLGRLLRIDPVTGHETELAAFTKPYAVRRAPSGSVFVTDGGSLERIDGAARPVRVAEAAGDIGPIAIAPNGDVYYSAAGAIFRLPGGKGTPVRVSGNAQLDVPHGLAVASDGAVLVADTGNDRILRIDVNGGVTALAKVTVPRGMEVAPDGSIYVVDGGASRVLHLGASGERLGVVGPVFDDPYDVTVAPGGVVYVIESLQSGDVRRIARDGTVTVLSRR